MADTSPQSHPRKPQNKALRNRKTVGSGRGKASGRDYLEFVPDCVLVTDAQGRIQFVNSQTERVFGYGREDLIGNPVEVLIPERFQAGHVIQRERYSADPYPRSTGGGLELVGRHKDGREFPVEIKLGPVKGAGSTQIIAVIRDITDRKRLEAELERQRNQLNIIADALQVMIAEVDADQRYRFTNRAYGEWFGHSPEDIRGRHMLDVLGEMNYRCERHYIEQALSGHEVSYEYDMLDRDGNTRRIWIRNVPHRMGSEEVNGFIALGCDISERKGLEDEFKKINLELQERVIERSTLLDQEKIKAQKYLDVAGVILVVIESDQTVSLINKKGCEVLECGEREILGKNWFDHFVPGEVRDRVREIFGRLIRGELEPVQYFENPVLTKSGHSRIIAWHNTVLRDEAGRIYATLSSGEDITERAELEAQVRQAEKLAAVGLLTSGLAHEIGTPLNVILGRAESMLGKMDCKDALRENLVSIIAQIERITRIVQQLLNFARSNPPQIRSVRPAAIINDTLALLEHQLAQQKIVSSVECAQDLPPIEADPDQIQQVLFNTFLNAIQAMPQGGRLSIRAAATNTRQYREDPAKDPLVKIEIADTGVGIPEEHLRKIFDPFFSTKEAGKGAGLGLSVSYSIMKRHGGWIHVKSRVGEGTVFTLCLPLSGGRCPEGLKRGGDVHG